VGYFKWAQMRGFKHGHIWSCPPQRGDNFIFWCHPPHQRTPSRDRLNAWYNSILLRSSKLGVLEEVGTLWSAYFSGYGRRESSGRKDKDKDKEDSRAGAGAVSVSTALPSVNSDVFMDDQMSVTSKCTVETGPSVLPIPSGSSSSSGRHCKADSTTAGGEPEDAPVCPPVFEGDFWVTECLRVHRLVMGRSKGCDGQDRGVNQRKCRDLLKDLMSKPSSIPFSRPVDIVKLNIPDYPTIITNPMNLGTIRDLLRTRYYKSILHFAEAVRLTFRNALRYNPVGHSIHETARMLSIEFEASLVELLSGYIGAVPKAENVDKYLDSYPIADPLPPPAPDDAALGPGQGPGPGPGRVPPLIPATTVPPTLPRARGRRKPSPLSEVIEDTANDSSMALTPVEGQAHFDTSTMDSIDGELPPLQRADSMDSMASRGSLLSTNTTPDVHDNWAPRLLFTSTVVPSTVPATENTGGLSGHPKAFEKPTLGFKGAMALMSEIAKSVFRLKDDLFVIKFADPTGTQRSALCKKSAANKGVNEGKTRVESVVPIAVASPLLPPEKDTDQEFYSAREFQSAGQKLKPKGVCFSEPVCGAGDGTHEIEGEFSTDVIATDSVKQEDDDHCSFLFPRPGRATLMATKYTSDMKSELHLGENGRDGKDMKDEGMRRTERDQRASNMDLSGAHTEEASMIAGSASIPGAQTDHSLTASLDVNGTVPVIVASYDGIGMTAEGSSCHHFQVKNPPPPLSAAPETTRHPRSPSRKRSNHKKSKSHHVGPKQKLAAAAAVVPISILDPDTATHEPLVAGPGGHANGAPDRLKKAKASTYLKQLSGEVDEAFEEKFSDRCLKLLAHLVPDTSDPDPIIKCAFVDNRHTFLEMCQFRHYQFDTLRRAKHSSLMLLYHLHFPDSANARPTCACCEGAIRDVRWHCDQCADFDICEQCYRAGEEVEAENAADLVSKHKGKEVPSSGITLAPSSQPLKVEKHCHPLTPFRITYV
jgi:Bromodomain/Zinc finger, ZZ type